MVDNHHIPGNTTLIFRQYSLHRTPAAYVDPNVFIPERWTSRRDLVKDEGAYAPFNVGPNRCVARQLAPMEMRCVVAAVVKRFDVGFADEAGGGVGFEEMVKDTFTAAPGALMVVFSERKMR